MDVPVATIANVESENGLIPVQLFLGELGASLEVLLVDEIVVCPH